MSESYPFSKDIVCAPDSFKGTLTAAEAAEAMASGVQSAWPDAPVRLLPLADGGEGSLEVLREAVGGELVPVPVQGPQGAPVTAPFLRLPDGSAVVEMAKASGLLLVAPPDRDAERASTFGTGQLIAAALDSGARRIIVCLGGSATSDGGAGMAEALGFRLLNGDGKPIERGGTALARLERIDPSGAHPGLSDVEMIAATDVINPLCGPSGAAAVYGPQKGASPEAIPRLDAGLARLAEVLQRDLRRDVRDLPGAGAAGGLGAGLVGFLGARIESGAEVLMDAAGAPAALARASLCLTGEGRVDLQSLQGKLVSRLARRCQAAGVPLIAIGGSVAAGAEALLKEGVRAVLSATEAPGQSVTDRDVAFEALRGTTEHACRLLQLGVDLSRESLTSPVASSGGGS